MQKSFDWLFEDPDFAQPRLEFREDLFQILQISFGLFQDLR